MHELSIAMSIVDTAIKQAEAASATQVSEVHLDIGVWSGIEFESLKFSLEIASKGSLLEDTAFKINRVEPLAECPACKHLYSPERLFSHCPECDQPGIRMIRGTELQIKYLLVE